MIKRIIFILVLAFIIGSCGKKDDPVYKSSTQNNYFYSKPFSIEKV